jgi:hypothetical protein
MMTAEKGMTPQQAQTLRVNDRVRDITCGREGVVVNRKPNYVGIYWERARPDGGEWLGASDSHLDTQDCDFLVKIEGRAAGMLMTSGQRSQLGNLLRNYGHACVLAYDNMNEDDSEKYDAREQKAQERVIAFVERLVERKEGK